MNVEFADMPNSSRVWLYRADRPLTANEQVYALEKLRAFTQQWAAHGTALQSCAICKYEQYLILLVNEKQAAASGCSIDASVHCIKEIGTQLGLNFFDRLSVSYLDETGVLQCVSKKAFKTAIADGVVTADTIVLNDMLQTKEDLENKWQQKLAESWLSRYLTAAIS